MEDNNYGMGREGRFDINGTELPKLPTFGRSDGWDGTSLMASAVPQSVLIDMAIEYYNKHGHKPTRAMVPGSNVGLKAFGRIIEKVGYISLDVVYGAKRLEVV